MTLTQEPQASAADQAVIRRLFDAHHAALFATVEKSNAELQLEIEARKQAAPPPPVKLKPSEKAVLLLIEGRAASTGTIARQSGLTYSGTGKLLNRMVTLGLVSKLRRAQWMGAIGITCLLLMPLLAFSGPIDFTSLKNKFPKVAAAAPVVQTYTLSFAWSPSTTASVTNYALFWGVKSGMYTNSVLCGTDNAQGIAGFIGGVNYFFAVRSLANGTNSVFSNEINFTPGPVTPPHTNFVTIAIEAADYMATNAPFTTVWSVTLTNPPGQRFFRLKQP